MSIIVTTSLADLRTGDRLIRVGEQRYREPREVVAPLAPLETGHPVEGVRLRNPNPNSPIEWVLYPSQVDGQAIELDRP